MRLFDAANDLEERSSHLGMFELGVIPMEPDDEGSSGESFLLIGVDESNKEAVDIFSEWREQWGDELTIVGSEELDMVPDVEIYEFEE